MNRQSGYSIIEVLIAFAVMSMTLAVLLPGQTLLLGRAGTAADRALAHDFALSRLEEIAVFGVQDSSDSYRDWRITQTSTGSVGQRQITVTVTGATGRELAQVTRRVGVRDVD